MTKQVDQNGFWLIENNPISKAGIFPYLGREISPAFEPNKIYHVYRPASELSRPETLKSFDLLPLINDHEMLGEEYTPAEDKGIDGVVSGPYFENGRLMASHIKIYTESMKNDIVQGKKDLSPGYTCDYDLTPGVWQFQHYDAVQRNITGNHVALVDQGRTGPDNRVYDGKPIIYDRKSIALDASKIKLIKAEEGMQDMKKASVIDRLAAKVKQVKDDIGELLANTVSEDAKKEILDKVDELTEELTEEETETTDADPDDDEEKEKEAEDEDPDDDDEDGDDKKETTDAKPKTKPKAKPQALDHRAIVADVLKAIAAKDSLAKELEPLVGTFDHSAMTAGQVASYGAKQLGLSAKTENEALAMVRGYLKAYKPEDVYSMDAAANNKGGDDGDFDEYAHQKGDK